MVNITLDEDWTLSSDSHQWILIYNGRPSKFYREIEDAIISYFKLKSRGSQATSFNGLMEYQKQLLCRLQQLLAPFKYDLEVKEKKE